MNLITETEAKNYLGYETGDHLPQLGLIIAGVSAGIINYLDGNTGFLDEETVPAEIKLAAAAWVGERFKNREGQLEAVVDTRHGYGYPPPVVVALIGHLRTPVAE